MDRFTMNPGGSSSGWAGHAETHVSAVYFVGDYAYKVLKPLCLAFLDHSTVEKRRVATFAELDLNRRLAPDVYLGVTPLRAGDDVLDYAIVMRRMPEDRRLSALVEARDFDEQLRAVAKKVASFHAGLPPDREAVHIASIPSERGRWHDNLDEITELADNTQFDERAIVAVRRLADGYLDGRKKMFAQRADEGMCRDGHGDLLASDIFCLDDGPRILDCLAFSTALRKGDVLADIAFLVMDIEQLAGTEASRGLLSWYQEFSNEHHQASLAHFYIAYRALVRAKVAAMRHIQTDDPRDKDDAADLFSLCAGHLRLATPRLVLVGGGAGTGKTTLSNSVAARLGWAVLSSDEVRKERAGLDARQHEFAEPDRGLYAPAVTAQTYAALCDEAAELLRHGESVILDASWFSGDHRAAARSVAQSTSSVLVELECRLDKALAKERIVRRLGSDRTTSDATPVIADHLATKHDSWLEAAAIDTARPLESCTEEAIEVIMRQG